MENCPPDCAARHLTDDDLAGMLALLDRLRWAKDVPTRDGFYWWRGSERAVPDVVQVMGGASAVWRFGCDDSEPPAGLGGEWCGPLVPPD